MLDNYELHSCAFIPSRPPLWPSLIFCISTLILKLEMTIVNLDLQFVDQMRRFPIRSNDLWRSVRSARNRATYLISPILSRLTLSTTRLNPPLSKAHEVDNVKIWMIFRRQWFLRYVGVIWFVFHVPQLLLIIFTQQNSCCTSNSLMKHLQKLDWKLDLPWFSYDYQKCMLIFWKLDT